jgi:hypothetical protein
MLIYSISFVMFMVSYVVLRSRYARPSGALLKGWSTARLQEAGRNAEQQGPSPPAETTDSTTDTTPPTAPPISMSSPKSLAQSLHAGQAALATGFLSDAAYLSAWRALYVRWRAVQPLVSGDGVFSVPGGVASGVAMVLLPAALFLTNATFAVIDSGCQTIEEELVCAGPFP